MKILFAAVRTPSSRSSTLPAEALPGVLAVFTAKDVPVNEYGLIMPDQPVLVRTWLEQASTPTGCALWATRWRWSSPRASRSLPRPRDLIAGGLRRLPVVTDSLAAMQPEPPCFTRSANPMSLCASASARGMLRRPRPGGRGDRRRVPHPCPGHAFLQPEAGIATSMRKGGSRSWSLGSGRTKTRSRSPMLSICHWSRCA